LEQPGDGATISTPEQKFDATVLVTTEAIAVRVDPPLARTDCPAPDATEVEEDVVGVESNTTEGPRVVEPALEIPSGEPILPLPPVSTVLPVAHLILAGEVAGTRQQQQPSAEHRGAAGTSSGWYLGLTAQVEVCCHNRTY
jgi:hypothetical protein